MNARLARLVTDLRRPRIAVLGDMILDRYVWGQVRRISPEAPVPVLNVRHVELRPGGAANVAHNLAQLEARVTPLGVVGRDEAGTALEHRLGAPLVRGPKLTAVKTRMIAHNQQMVRVDEEDTTPLDRASERRLAQAIRRAAHSCEALIISDYAKGTLTPRVVESALAAFRGRPVLVGLKSRDAPKYRGATGAMLNREELAAVAPSARYLIRQLGLEFLVVTLGPDGILLEPRRGRPTHFGTMARAVYDVTGAGDTCLAAFALAHLSGCALADCAAIANAAAGVAVGKVGTATATRPEILRHVMPAQGAADRKIVGLPELRRTVASERARGRRIVLTNGCFDLLHPGHLAVLRAARGAGDLVVVAINSDRSVRRLKGPGRPILSQEARAELLASLEAVDYVVIFHEPTPQRVIRAIRPDVLVKGADWRGRRVVGADLVARWGGRTILAPRVEGYSTTAIEGRIRDGAP